MDAPGEETGCTKRRIFQIDIVAATQPKAVTLVVSAVERRSAEIFAFCNAHTANIARKRADFRTILSGTTLFNDGVGIDIASRAFYGSSFPANLNGTDLTPLILAALPPGTKVFLLGSRRGVADRARSILAKRNPALQFVGTAQGYFKRRSEPALLARIVASGADLVLVGMGHPFQEEWATRNVAQIGVPLLCIGAFLDFTAGVIPRAPAWMRHIRFEWLYRLLKEPRRMSHRYIVGNATFLLAVLREKRRRERS